MTHTHPIRAYTPDPGAPDPRKSHSRRLEQWLRALLTGPEAAGADMDSPHDPIHEDLRPLHIGIEDAICLGRPKLPLATVVIPDVAAEHLGLAAEITLSQRVFS